MLNLSQRCQYALRAAFELAARPYGMAASVVEIAAAQAIPVRFLEQILKDFKRAGIVGARRGRQGGYVLLRSPSDITVGDIVRLVNGPIRPVKCITAGGADCPLRGECVFEDLWTSIGQAVSRTLDRTTLRGLVDKQRRQRRFRNGSTRRVTVGGLGHTG